jgi:hypothetical protein
MVTPNISVGSSRLYNFRPILLGVRRGFAAFKSKHFKAKMFHPRME